MKRLAFGSILPLALLLLAACSGTPVGALTFSTTGLPAGESGSALLTGPFGYSETIDDGDTVSDLRIGTYTLSPVPVVAANTGFAGSEHFAAPSQDVEVLRNETAAPVAGYAYTGLSVSDAEDDANGASVDFPIYELTEVSSAITGGVLEVTLTFLEEQDDLSMLFLIMDLDTDQDETTGEDFVGSGYCSGGPLAGGEYFVQALPGSGSGIVDRSTDLQVGTPTVTDSANSLVIAIDLTDIGGDDGRVDLGLAVGNEDEPTDCLPPLGNVLAP